MIWSASFADARQAQRLQLPFAAAVRSFGLSVESQRLAEVHYDTLLRDVVAYAPGPALIELAARGGVLELSVEDIGAARTSASLAGATIAPRDLLGARAHVVLGEISTPPETWMRSDEAARRSFERWEFAGWIDHHAHAVVAQALTDIESEIGQISNAPKAAIARHLALSFRHLGNAIALGDVDLFVNEVRWLLGSHAAGAPPDVRALVATFELALLSLNAQLPTQLTDMLQPVLRAIAAIAAPPSKPTYLESPLAERFFSAFSADERSIDAFIKEALALGLSRRAIYLDMLQQAQRETGRRWHLGTLSIEEEARRTAVAMRLMTALRSSTPKRERHGLLFGATAPGEDHQVGLQMVCDLAAMDGWDVRTAAPGLPAAALVDAMDAATPDVIALSATMSAHVTGLIGVIAEIRLRPRLTDCAIVVGGAPFSAFPHLSRIVGADLCAHDAADAVESLRAYSRSARRLLQSLRQQAERRS